MTRKPAPTAAIAEIAANVVATSPGCNHLAHIDANDMLSAESRFGPVVSTTVRYHSRSNVRFPFHPYVSAGSNRPANKTVIHAAAARNPWVTVSHGSSTSAYGLTNAPSARQTPATTPRPCCAATTAPSISKAIGRLNWPNASSLTRNLPIRRNVIQPSTWIDWRRAGSAMIDVRRNVQAIAANSTNQASSAASFGSQTNGTMNGANTGRYLYW